MVDTAALALSLALVGLVAVFIFVQVPLWGVGPTWLKKIWTKIIRFFLRGDKRSWNWTEIEPGLYVGSLPRLPEDLKELQTAPHNLGGIVSLVEPWEVQVSGEVLQELGIEWLLLPTPDYSAPTMKDVEMAVQFIDRQARGGQGVLVHCNAGRGRSVVVTIAYLLVKHRAEDWDCYRALQAVQAQRPTAPLLSCCETRPQWRAVRSFERRLRCHSFAPAHRDDPHAAPPAPMHDSALSAHIGTSRGEKGTRAQIGTSRGDEGPLDGGRSGRAGDPPAPAEEAAFGPTDATASRLYPPPHDADTRLSQAPSAGALVSASPQRASVLGHKPLPSKVSVDGDPPLQDPHLVAVLGEDGQGEDEHMPPDLAGLIASAEPEAVVGVAAAANAVTAATAARHSTCGRASLSHVDVRESALLGGREAEDDKALLPGTPMQQGTGSPR